MSESISRLSGRVLGDYLNNGHLVYLIGDLNAIAEVGQLTAEQATQVVGYYALMGQLYTAMLSVSGGSLGAGTEGLDVPLTGMLGSAAFLSPSQFAVRRPVTQDAAYQVLPQDFWTAMLLTTSGTRTYTLPAWTDMPDFVPPLIGKNRSGNNLTLARTGSDTFDAAAISVTVPTGSSWECYKSDTSGLWETRVFA